ncbi:MAG: hypothetical protein NTX69_03655, partial [Candidatus Bipolaricaulota bacterium]|nr:hypothetical protein [Candidatus Bipolaricaulota bacterium]
MRIVYGVQSTGKGHLSRFLGLLPLFRRDGHELLVLVTGRWDPPRYFLDALAGTRFRRFPGLPMVADGVGGISKRGTVKAFATRLPGLFNSFRKAHRWISAFDPDLIVSDFDPVTGSPFVAPGVFKVGIGNYFTPARRDVEHPAGLRRERFNVRVADKMITSGLDVRIGCHFYPLDDECLPPILRPETLTMAPENRGHLVVYHAFPGLLPPVLAYATSHPATPVILYGYETRPRGLPDNVRLEADADRFLRDLATCEAFVGTAGFSRLPRRSTSERRSSSSRSRATTNRSGTRHNSSFTVWGSAAAGTSRPILRSRSTTPCTSASSRGIGAGRNATT